MKFDNPRLKIVVEDGHPFAEMLELVDVDCTLAAPLIADVTIAGVTQSYQLGELERRADSHAGVRIKTRWLPRGQPRT